MFKRCLIIESDLTCQTVRVRIAASAAYVRSTASLARSVMLRKSTQSLPHALRVVRRDSFGFIDANN